MYINSIWIGISIATLAFTIILLLLLFWFNPHKKTSKKKTKAKRKTKNKKFEFSKIVLTSVLLTYFLGLYIGCKIVTFDYTQLSALLTYIGAPTATAIAFYSWKAKAENIVKIKQKYPKETKDMNIDLNNIT